MTNMEHALTVAGVKLPSQNQRIWQWLKDNGPHSVKDLASELVIGAQTVQATVGIMVRRKMLEKIERKNHKLKRLDNHYAALGRTFELKPEPKKGAAGRAAANAKRVSLREATWDDDDESPKATPTFSPETLLSSCTLAELRQVHTFLKGMFK